MSKLIKLFSSINILQTLKDLLLKNLDKIPLTDLYLMHPLLKSKTRRENFKPVALDFIEKQNLGNVRELVNSAALTVLTYIMAGGKRSSNLVIKTLDWIRKQRLDDGGWHWKPKANIVSEESEAWCTALVYASFKIANVSIDQSTIAEFLRSKWILDKWGGFPEITLIYLSYAGYNEKHELVKEPLNYLRETQLSNGAWAGYSPKTSRGGIFRTCIVLNALTSMGLKLEEQAVFKGLKFLKLRVKRVLNAKWGSILVQALYGLASTLLNLNLEK